jgi:hypothetical protein
MNALLDLVWNTLIFLMKFFTQKYTKASLKLSTSNGGVVIFIGPTEKKLFQVAS